MRQAVSKGKRGRSRGGRGRWPGKGRWGLLGRRGRQRREGRESGIARVGLRSGYLGTEAG